MPLRISKNRIQLDTVPLNLAAEVDVASAATTSIGAALSNNIRITGTTTITSLGTADAGITRTLRFASALTLTYNATSLILPGGGSITTATNDTAELLSLGSGNWFCKVYNPATGTASKSYVARGGDNLTAITTNGAGDVDGYTLDGIAYVITYDGSSRVSTITGGGKTQTVTYDGSGNVVSVLTT